MRLSEQGAPLIPPGGSEANRLKSRTNLRRAGVDYSSHHYIVPQYMMRGTETAE
jgi:hypothetical protein